MTVFDSGVVAKGLISTVRGSQPIAERAVGLGNHSFLHHTKQKSMQIVHQKSAQCVKLQAVACINIHAQVFFHHTHTQTHAHVHMHRLLHISTETNQRKLWMVTFHCGIRLPAVLF